MKKYYDGLATLGGGETDEKDRQVENNNKEQESETTSQGEGLKSVNQRTNLDLLELVCQLHYRALQYQTKDLHDAYVEARTELESRFPATPPSIEGKQEIKEELEYFRNVIKAMAIDLPEKEWDEVNSRWLSLQHKIYSQFTPIASKEVEYREALENIVKSWDERVNEREQLKHFEGMEYWSPASSMIESKWIAAARKALNK